jgi:cell division topological specificity factor
MASLFDRLMGRREPTSAEVAKERLKLVLVTDRSNLSPEKLEEMQHEIIMVIKRYIHIDEMQVQIKIEQRERKHFLVADIPLQRDQSYAALEYPQDPTYQPKVVGAEVQADVSEGDTAEVAQPAALAEDSAETDQAEPSANEESPAQDDAESDADD